MIHLGDLFTVLPTLKAESFDACVTDGPYGIGFMGKKWDTFKPGAGATRKLMHPRERARAAIVSANPNINGRWRSPALSPSQIEYDFSAAGLRGFQEFTARWAVEIFRVLKPGGYILSCGGPRSHHRMMCGLEDAGFVVRDCFAWLFGSGFPKNKNLGEGRGTALKPAHEPIALAWKPFKGTISGNVAQFGTGALNIDACRLVGASTLRTQRGTTQAWEGGAFSGDRVNGSDLGRWPANVILDVEAAALLDEQTGELHTKGAWPTTRRASKFSDIYEGGFTGQTELSRRDANSGGASRFYYVAKPSRRERDRGCKDLEEQTGGTATDRKDGSKGLGNPRAGAGRTGGARNIHPTVKPVELMRWLVRLVTPPGGHVIDPFLGSGTTGMACRFEGRKFTGIEREAAYVEIARRRIASVRDRSKRTA